MLFYRVAPVAQRIEQLPSKQLVTGSIPVWGTIFFAMVGKKNMKPAKAALHTLRDCAKCFIRR